LQHDLSYQRATQQFHLVATVHDNDFVGGGKITSKEEAVWLCKSVFSPNIPETQSEGLYQSYEWGGDELQVILLDLRSFSSPNATDENTFLSLGDEQWEWLEDQMDKDFRQRLVISSLQVLATGHTWDCWKNSMVQSNDRNRLLSLLRGKRALLLTGDRHVSALYCQEEDEQQFRQYEITASSLTHSVPPGVLDGEEDEHRVSDFVYENNFGMLEWTAEAGSGDAQVEATIRSTKSGQVLQQWQLHLS
jgi:alkaline phosphatase D